MTVKLEHTTPICHYCAEAMIQKPATHAYCEYLPMKSDCQSITIRFCCAKHAESVVNAFLKEEMWKQSYMLTQFWSGEVIQLRDEQTVQAISLTDAPGDKA